MRAMFTLLQVHYLVSQHSTFVTNSGRGRRKEPDNDNFLNSFADDVKAILQEAKSKLQKAEDDIGGKLVSNDVL